MDIDKFLPIQKCLLEFISNIINYKYFVFKSEIDVSQCDLLLVVCKSVVSRLDEFICVVEKRKEILINEKKIKKESK